MKNKEKHRVIGDIEKEVFYWDKNNGCLNFEVENSATFFNNNIYKYVKELI